MTGACSSAATPIPCPRNDVRVWVDAVVVVVAVVGFASFFSIVTSRRRCVKCDTPGESKCALVFFFFLAFPLDGVPTDVDVVGGQTAPASQHPASPRAKRDHHQRRRLLIARRRDPPKSDTIGPTLQLCAERLLLSSSLHAPTGPGETSAGPPVPTPAVSTASRGREGGRPAAPRAEAGEGGTRRKTGTSPLKRGRGWRSASLPEW